MSHRFKRLYPYLWRYRVAIFWGMVCLVATNFLEIRVAMLVGNGIDMLRLPFGPFTGLQRAALTLFAVLVAGLAVGMAVTRFWMRRLIIGASRRIEYDFRNDFFTHLLRLSPSFYDRYRTGDIMSRATSDMDAIRMVIGPSIMYLTNTVTVLPMAIAQMLAISAILTGLVWLPLITLAPLFYYFKSRIHRRFRRVQELMSDLSTYVQETLAGVRVIKIFGREAGRSRDFNRVSDQYVASNIGLARLQAVFIPMLMLIVGLAVLMLIWAGSWLIIHGRLTIGQLTSFFLLLNWSVWPLIALGWVLTQIERGSASMLRVEEIFRQQPDIAPAYDSQKADVGPAPSPAIPIKLCGRIEIRDLTFQYPTAEEPALRNLNLIIEPGATLGLTGPVGCGKSTLARLLARRYNPPRGSVFVDGVDILDWPPHELRRQIGVVDQEPFLFSDTIAANILFGSRGDGRARQYADAAQLASDVDSFPAGYETLLGERGINLSGGQRQRVALARALGREPALLILDDALAAVDTHTEEAILSGLKQLLKGRTTLIISHRISTVSLADEIAYMDRGRIVEQGTHAELMALRGRYHDLARRQQLAAEIERTA
ncbi:MAG: ABC transporter ATP-binding protein [Candidatus Sumerlaeia bacterium]